MTNEQILELIADSESNNVETERVEFKDGSNGFSGNQVWSTISAFSHRPDGGLLVYGVRENQDKSFTVTGVNDPALIQEAMINFCREDMVGCADPDFKILEYKGKRLLIFLIHGIPDERKPCFKKSLGMHHGACVRVGNVSKVITFEEARQFARNSVPFKYDNLPVEDTHFDDLSLEKIRNFLEKSAIKKGRDVSILSQVGAVKTVVENIGICIKDNNQLVPTNAGYLTFATRTPQAHKNFKRLIVRCIHYKGNTSASPIVDKIDLEGTLDEQIEGMQTFIMKSIPLSAKIIGTKRVEQYEYPPEAIREIVANAVIHRDYSIIETYTQIAVFANRIEVSNPGNLPPGVTVENIREAQFSRNVIISAILRDMEYMEEYGRGIEIVYASMNEYGLLGPLFKNSTNSFRVTLLGQQFSSLNQRQLKIWQTLQETGRSITALDCVELLSGTSRPAITLDLKNMVDIGLIQKKGAGPNTHYLACF